MDESREWLKTYKQREKERQTLVRDFQTRRDYEIKTTTRKEATTTMKGPVVFQNELSAGMYDDNKTGFKDKFDPCNKSNKSNGGVFRTYESAYMRTFSEPDNLKVKFREDGVPISAQRTGKSLMSPKPPSEWERTEGKRILAKNDRTNIVLGNPNMKDPKFYKPVSHIFHKKHHRMLMQPNPGIASEDSKRAHRRQGL